MTDVKYDPILGCTGWEFKKTFTKETSKKRKKSKNTNQSKNNHYEKNRR
tara:strand:+ start:148 stop:294 length:147 start_codon:yes stop_codon:yes gene_type:complete